MEEYKFYVYVVTNSQRVVIYTGVTNNLPQRLIEHWMNRGNRNTFAGKYYCYHLIYYEVFDDIEKAIVREKEIKGWRREKKLNLIKSQNPDWAFLNHKICGSWPPTEIKKRF